MLARNHLPYWVVTTELRPDHYGLARSLQGADTVLSELRRTVGSQMAAYLTRTPEEARGVDLTEDQERRARALLRLTATASRLLSHAELLTWLITPSVDLNYRTPTELFRHGDPDDVLTDLLRSIPSMHATLAPPADRPQS